MSVFDDHITSKTKLEDFHDTCRDWFEINFHQTWKRWYENINWAASEFNKMLGDKELHKLFESYGMYAPWVCLDNQEEGTIELTIFYSDDPSIYVHKNAKIFLQMKFNV